MIITIPLGMECVHPDSMDKANKYNCRLLLWQLPLNDNEFFFRVNKKYL